VVVGLQAKGLLASVVRGTDLTDSNVQKFIFCTIEPHGAGAQTIAESGETAIAAAVDLSKKRGRSRGKRFRRNSAAQGDGRKTRSVDQWKIGIAFSEVVVKRASPAK